MTLGKHGMGRTRPAWLGTAVLLMAWLVWTAPLSAQQGDTGTVRGNILGLGEPLPAETPVVLLRFTLGEDGKPSGGPIARQMANADGSYEFRDVPLSNQAVYRLGTSLNGELIGSDLFTFPRGARELRIDLRADGAAGDSAGPTIDQALLALEPGVGRLRVTVVYHMRNAGAAAAPLLFAVPGNAREVEVVRQDLPGGQAEVAPAGIRLSGELPAGRFVIAYQYMLPAGWGRASIDHQVPLPTDSLIVLAQPGSMEVGGTGLTPRGEQTIDASIYNVWSQEDLPAGAVQPVTISGLPMQQSLLLIPMAGFLVVMAGMVMLYLRRLRRAAEPAA